MKVLYLIFAALSTLWGCNASTCVLLANDGSALVNCDDPVQPTVILFGRPSCAVSAHLASILNADSGVFVTIANTTNAINLVHWACHPVIIEPMIHSNNHLPTLPYQTEIFMFNHLHSVDITNIETLSTYYRVPPDRTARQARGDGRQPPLSVDQSSRCQSANASNYAFADDDDFSSRNESIPESMHCSFLNLTSITTSIAHFFSAVTIYLHFGHNSITLIGNVTFENCTNVTTLGLNNNLISRIEDGSFYRMTQLEFLNLYYNQLSYLPGLIFSKLTELRLLQLFHNLLSILSPDSMNLFLHLTHLQILNLAGNFISILTADAFNTSIFQPLTNLEFLFLSGNNLTSLPNALCSSSQLEGLDLSQNFISELPAGLFNSNTSYKQLAYLSLAENLITSLPNYIFANLSALIELYLYGNDITILTVESFPLNPMLRVLDLSKNQIKVIQDNMRSFWHESVLGGLTVLSMAGNPSTCILRYNRLLSLSEFCPSNISCSLVFCFCAPWHIGRDFCVSSRDAYLEIPSLMTAYTSSCISVEGYANAFDNQSTCINNSGSFVRGSDFLSQQLAESYKFQLIGNTPLPYTISVQLMSSTANVGIAWAMSAFFLNVNSSVYLQCQAFLTCNTNCVQNISQRLDKYNITACLQRFPRYIPDGGFIVRSSAKTPFQPIEIEALMNHNVATSVNFSFACNCLNGCQNYFLNDHEDGSCPPLLISSIIQFINASDNQGGRNVSSITRLQLSGTFLLSIEFFVQVIANEIISNESYNVGNITFQITDCNTNASEGDLQCSFHGRCSDDHSPYNNIFSCKCYPGYVSSNCSTLVVTRSSGNTVGECAAIGIGMSVGFLVLLASLTMLLRTKKRKWDLKRKTKMGYLEELLTESASEVHNSLPSAVHNCFVFNSNCPSAFLPF